MGVIARISVGAALAAVLACSPGKEPETPTISLRMTGSPPDARVTVDDQLVGTLDVVAVRGVAMPPGQHRVSVERQGYFPFDTLVDAKEGQGPVKIEAKLVPVPE
jgi:hypothetical protein